MDDIVEEASALVQCKECAWYKNCVSPMRFNPDEVKRQFQSAMPGLQPGAFPGGGDDLSRFLLEMTSAAQNLLLEGCPIFIRRLQNSRKLAARIKQLMQTWGMDENENASV